MGLKVIKRDGREEEFTRERILKAVTFAMNDANENTVKPEGITDAVIENINKLVTSMNKDKPITVELIHDIVINTLYKKNCAIAAEHYKSYRDERNKTRQLKSDLLKTVSKINVETDRDNANVGNNFSSKLLRVASEVNKVVNLATMPKEIAKLHENADIHFHDLDCFSTTINCLHVPIDRLLDSGFNTGYGDIISPKSKLESAANLSCILIQSSQNDMFGGQSFPDYDKTMGKRIVKRREYLIDKIAEGDRFTVGGELTEEQIERSKQKAISQINDELDQSNQNIVYNLNSMHARSGSQVPFSSVNIGIMRNEDEKKACESFLRVFGKGMGHGTSFIFPNVIYRMKFGINKPGDKYYDTTKLAYEVAARRCNPTFMNMDATMCKALWDQGIDANIMGCRTFVGDNINGQKGPVGRGNIAPHTINLPRIGIKAKLQSDKTGEDIYEIFFRMLDEMIEKAKDTLLYRYEVLKNLKVKDLPFVAGQKLIVGSENLNQDDSIEEILKNGTFGIGFIGLAETLVALIGKHHGMDKFAHGLGLSIIEFFRLRTDRYKKDYKLNFATYATPAESINFRFVIADRARFGVIPGVTDKDYYTNSFHIPPAFQISMRKKLLLESPFHRLCNAGVISYVEMDDYPTPELVQEVVEFAFGETDIHYLGINFHIRDCKKCGAPLYAHHKACPNCGNDDILRASRVTGYIALDERFGPGKVAERKDRISHFSDIKPYSNI